MKIIDQFKTHCVKIEAVGSRVTCNPAPTDTDADYLLLFSSDESMHEFEHRIIYDGYAMGGSKITDENNSSFRSYTKNEVNLILTYEEEFFDRFMESTLVAKHLNLLKKESRVALFQAILYGAFQEIF